MGGWVRKRLDERMKVKKCSLHGDVRLLKPFQSNSLVVLLCLLISVS